MELGSKFIPDDTVCVVQLGGADFSVLLFNVMIYSMIWRIIPKAVNCLWWSSL